MSNDYSFPVGKIVGFHGLKGEIKIRPETNNPTLLLDIDDAEIVLKQERVKVTIEDLRLEKRMIFLKLENFPDRTSVEHFLNALVFTTREQLNDLEEDEWWVDDLVGLVVVTPDGREVGTVSGITGNAGELLEVKSTDSEGSFLVPFVKALVPEVDIKGGRIVVVDLPGLFNLR